jgi:serine protease
MRSPTLSLTLLPILAALLTACPGNRPPSVSSIVLDPSATVQPCASVNVNVTASDPEGAKLTYDFKVVSADVSMTPLPSAFVTQNGANASFVISPSPTVNTSVRVRLEVSDGVNPIITLSQPVTLLGGQAQPCGSIEGQVRPGVRFSSASTPSDAEFRPDEAIVKLKPDHLRPADLSSRTDRIAFVRSVAGGSGIVRRGSAGLSKLGAGSEIVRAGSARGRETLSWIEQLRARPDVLYAEPNLILRAQAVPTDPLYDGGATPERSQRWNYEMLNLPAAWDQTTGSGDVTVAVIDTGLLWSQTDPTRRHPDFDCEVAPGVPKVLPGFDLLGNTNDAYDSDPTADYHGTHVAGTVGACANNAQGGVGVAWGARILPIRALNGRGGSIEDIARAIYWAVGATIPTSFGSGADIPANPNPANIINMSLGGRGAPSKTLQDAIDTATARGTVVIVAAGNDGVDASVFLPANQQGVIAVGALGPTKTRPAYSNYGPNVSLVAPGGDQGLQRRIEDGVLSSIGVCPKDANGATLPGCGTSVTPNFDYGFEQGTSMASPHVAGVVALMMSAQASLRAPTDPAHNWVRVAGLLRDASSLTGLLLCERGCGAGLLDANKAITNAISNTDTGPFLVQLKDSGTTGTTYGSIDLGSSSTTATFAIRNEGTQAANINLTPSAPGLKVSPSQTSLAPNGVLNVTVTLERANLAQGTYGSSITMSYGTNRSLVMPVYYMQGGPGVLSDTTNVRVRLYKRDYNCQSNQQRLNFPGLSVDQDGRFRFPNLEVGTYDLVAYRLTSDKPDGAGVSELGRLDEIGVGTSGLQLKAQDVTLEAVNLTIGAEQPASPTCIPKN